MSLDRVDIKVVEVLKSALPEGAATEETLLDVVAELKKLDLNTDGLELLVSDSQVTIDGSAHNLTANPKAEDILKQSLNTLTKIELHLRHMTGVEYGGQDT